MTIYPQKKSGFSGITFISLLLLIALAVGFYLYKKQLDQAVAQSAMHMPPPSVVEYVEVETETVRLWKNFSGKLSAVELAAIKPQIDGEIQQVLFTDGQHINKGEPLFVIDPRPYQADINRIEAQLVSAQSREKLAKDELVRAEQLVKKKLVSDSVYDAAKNEFKVATATIAELRSALVEAKINLDYCYIKAPFSGRLSRAELTVGNVVQTMSGAPTLTTLVATDNLYVEFDVDEQTYIRSIRGVSDVTTMPVRVSLAEDNDIVYEGHIYAFDNQLSTSSGTIRARAILENTDNVLLPGMFVSVQLGQAQQQSLILLPEKAISTNQSQKYVLVVAEDGTAQYKPVQIGDMIGERRVIKAGLDIGEKVIVNGLSHTRPGAPVNASPVVNNS